MRRFLTAFAFALVASAAPGQSAEPADDAAVRRALHAALNGDSARVALIAGERSRFEDEAAARGDTVRHLGENIAVLALAAERPAPDTVSAKRLLAGYDRDGEVEAFLELVRETDPRDRFRTARANSVYEKRRRTVNSAVNALAGVVQLRVFALIQPPLDYLEYIANGYRYLNPEERRELRAARDVVAMTVADKPPQAARIVRGWTPLRRQTSVLQARRNAEMAERAGRPQTAAWWWSQERLLRGDGAAWRRANVDLQTDIERRAQRIRESDAIDANAEPVSSSAYRDLLAAFLRNPSDPATVETAARAAVSLWDTQMQGELRMVEAIQSRDAGDSLYYRAQLEQLAATPTAEGARMEAYLERPDFTPSVAFDRARSAVRARKWAFLLNGTPPAAPSRDHMTAEEARLREASWIVRARSLFVFDTFARLVAFPFLPGHAFPREEIFEAYRAAPPEFLKTGRGRDEALRTARAFEAMRRHEEAARVYADQAEFALADRARDRAARRVERVAGGQASPAVRAAMYERLLTAYPNYAKRARVERKRAESEREAETIVAIPRKDLRRYPELWGDEGLRLSRELVLGGSGLGGVTREGVALLRGDRIAYARADTKETFRIDLPEGAVARTLRLYAARRRTLDVGDELDEPRELKRIPIAIQGGAVPGFAVAPALVPLDPDPEIRRLYR